MNQVMYQSELSYPIADSTNRINLDLIFSWHSTAQLRKQNRNKKKSLRSDASDW